MAALAKLVDKRATKPTITPPNVVPTAGTALQDQQRPRAVWQRYLRETEL